MRKELEKESIPYNEALALKELTPNVIFNNTDYYGVKEFDGKVINLFTEPTLSGTFLTVIPISSLEYRKKNNSSKATAKVVEDSDWTNFIITNDWGDTKNIALHNSLKEEILYAKSKLSEYGLLTSNTTTNE